MPRAETFKVQGPPGASKRKGFRSHRSKRILGYAVTALSGQGNFRNTPRYSPVTPLQAPGPRFRPLATLRWRPAHAAESAGPMSPKHHHIPLSGGDRKALTKELAKSRAMTRIFAERSAEKRREGEALIREADNLACQSWNEKLWSDGGPIDPSPTIDQAINGGYSFLEIECSRCRARRDVDLAALRRPSTTFVHDLAGCLVCQKCKGAGKRPAATLLQLAPRSRAST